jgi:hypothetical protein
MLRWHDRLWLIDHGAALYLAHGGLDPVAQAERPFPMIAEHVLLAHAGPVRGAASRLADRITAEAIERVVGLVPPEWFAGIDPPEAYAEYLTRRLVWGGFAEEADRARDGRG